MEVVLVPYPNATTSITQVVGFYTWAETSNVTVEGWAGGEGYLCDNAETHQIFRCDQTTLRT